MASKKNEASEAAVLDTASDLLAELAEEAAERAAVVPAEVTPAAPSRTVVSTNTVYEDRTEKPELEPEVEYELSHVDLGHGTILTNVGSVRNG